VTGRVDSPPALSGLPDASRVLVGRFGGGWADVPATESAGDWAASLASHLPAAAAFAVLEHLFGVLPLLDAFFEPGGAIAEVASGVKLGSLGLFTPSPELGWAAAAVAGELSGGGLLLRGGIRLPSPASDGSIVLVRLGDGPEHRLAWLDHDARGGALVPHAKIVCDKWHADTGNPARGTPVVVIHVPHIPHGRVAIADV